MLEIISRIVDGSKFIEYKKEYGKTIICGTAKIGGFSVFFLIFNKLTPINYP
jgi:acetyl-CoA carboxylase carboxyltransferase component